MSSIHQIRKSKPNCHVCGKHSSVIQWHHLVPQSEQRKSDHDIVPDFVNTVYALCPNCHCYIHKLLKKPTLDNSHTSHYSEWQETFLANGYTSEEMNRVGDILSRYEDAHWSVRRAKANVIQAKLGV